jgi:ZIP family zinc transporter
MSEWLTIALLTLVAGLAMGVGGLLAMAERLIPRPLDVGVQHTIIAFGGGILLAAVAFVLVPEGMTNLSPLTTSLYFAAGGVAFTGVDIALHRRGKGTPQLAAMLLDFVPELIALGSLYSLNKAYALLFFVLIALQNIPEGFNAYCELRSVSKYSKGRVLALFGLLSLIGPVAALVGHFFLAESRGIIARLMVFAGGGILYLVFQDIAPQARLKRHWTPALGAVAGFLLGMMSKMAILPD